MGERSVTVTDRRPTTKKVKTNVVRPRVMTLNCRVNVNADFASLTPNRSHPKNRIRYASTITTAAIKQKVTNVTTTGCVTSQAWVGRDRRYL